MAFGTAGLLLGVREVMHRRWLPIGGDRCAYLLLCPNLTIVALGASTLLEARSGTEGAAWLLLTGLLMTMFSIVSLPVTGNGRRLNPKTPVSNQMTEERPPDRAGEPIDEIGEMGVSSLLVDGPVKMENR
jgi:membrane protein implicated in regulation of membrane protease activity